jgi:hypothetical protein
MTRDHFSLPGITRAGSSSDDTTKGLISAWPFCGTVGTPVETVAKIGNSDQITCARTDPGARRCARMRVSDLITRAHAYRSVVLRFYPHHWTF